MPGPVDLNIAFGLPPERALEYFRSRGYAITWNWQDALNDAHARAFTVAKAARLEILYDIRQELERAIKGEIALRDFIRELEPRLKARGWWGKQVIVDSEGRAQQVQLGSPHRLKTIYRTNLQSAYMAGREREFMANVAQRPYWQYVAVMDARTRPSHAALHGKIFPAEDPFWDHFYPPNGFNCRCRVRALSQRDVERGGLAVSRSGDDLKTVEIVDPRTGLVERVASYRGPGMRFAVTPDVGFNGNPGRAWALWDAGRSVPDDALPPPSLTQYTFRDYSLPPLAAVPRQKWLSSPGVRAAAASQSEALALIASDLELDMDRPVRVVRTPAGDVALRLELVAPAVADREAQRERFVGFVVPTLEQPYEVWLAADGDGYRRRYLAIYRERSGPWLALVRENRDGSLLWEVRPLDDAGDAARRGALLWPRRSEE